MRNRFFHHEKPPLHVLAKTPLGEWPLPIDEAWAVFCETIKEFQEDLRLYTHAFVLMGNHYHWICTFDMQADPGMFEWFHEVLNMKFLEAAHPCADLFYCLEPEPKVIPLDPFPFFKATYRYVYANPVKAGLVTQAQHYPYSTLGWMLEGRESLFPLIDNMHLIIDPIRTIQWINGQDDEGLSPVSLLPLMGLRWDWLLGK